MAISNVNRILRQMTRAIRRESSDTVLEVLDEIKRATPVDTGFAKANWIASIGSPFKGIVGSKQAVSTSKQATNEQLIATWSIEKGRVFITNNVPYIGILNSGSSRQAPSMFIEKAFQTVLAASNRKQLK